MTEAKNNAEIGLYCSYTTAFSQLNTLQCEINNNVRNRHFVPDKPTKYSYGDAENAKHENAGKENSAFKSELASRCR